MSNDRSISLEEYLLENNLCGVFNTLVASTSAAQLNGLAKSSPQTGASATVGTAQTDAAGEMLRTLQNLHIQRAGLVPRRTVDGPTAKSALAGKRTVIFTDLNTGHPAQFAQRMEYLVRTVKALVGLNCRLLVLFVDAAAAVGAYADAIKSMGSISAAGWSASAAAGETVLPSASTAAAAATAGGIPLVLPGGADVTVLHLQEALRRERLSLVALPSAGSLEAIDTTNLPANEILCLSNLLNTTAGYAMEGPQGTSTRSPSGPSHPPVNSLKSLIGMEGDDGVEKTPHAPMQLVSIVGAGDGAWPFVHAVTAFGEIYVCDSLTPMDALCAANVQLPQAIGDVMLGLAAAADIRCVGPVIAGAAPADNGDRVLLVGDGADGRSTLPILHEAGTLVHMFDTVVLTREAALAHYLLFGHDGNRPTPEAGAPTLAKDVSRSTKEAVEALRVEAARAGVTLLVAKDCVAAKPKPGAQQHVVSLGDAMPPKCVYRDIGPATAAAIVAVVSRCGSMLAVGNVGDAALAGSLAGGAAAIASATPSKALVVVAGEEWSILARGGSVAPLAAPPAPSPSQPPTATPAMGRASLLPPPAPAPASLLPAHVHCTLLPPRAIATLLGGRPLKAMPMLPAPAPRKS